MRDAPDKPCHISGYPEAINDRRIEEVLVQGIGRNLGNGGVDPQSSGLARPFRSRTRERLGAASGAISPLMDPDRNPFRSLERTLSGSPGQHRRRQMSTPRRPGLAGSSGLLDTDNPVRSAVRFRVVERWEARFSFSPSTAGCGEAERERSADMR